MTYLTIRLTPTLRADWKRRGAFAITLASPRPPRATKRAKSKTTTNRGVSYHDVSADLARLIREDCEQMIRSLEPLTTRESLPPLYAYRALARQIAGAKWPPRLGPASSRQRRTP